MTCILWCSSIRHLTFSLKLAYNRGDSIPQIERKQIPLLWVNCAQNVIPQNPSLSLPGGRIVLTASAIGARAVNQKATRTGARRIRKGEGQDLVCLEGGGSPNLLPFNAGTQNIQTPSKQVVKSIVPGS